MAKVYVYVVARDFGFAPNPFHGVCTLATCKPAIRRTAQVGDWVFGMGGKKLKAVGRCIYAMQVSRALSFDDYWGAPEYRSKRPVRNGSRKKIMGDNIYHRASGSYEWQQSDSHHSQTDGLPDTHNVQHDTNTDRVLVAEHFIYFGTSAPTVPGQVLDSIGFRNQIGHRVYPIDDAKPLLSWLNSGYANRMNLVLGDPFQFTMSGARYSKKVDRVI